MTLREALATRGSITGFRLLNSTNSDLTCYYESINDYQYLLHTNDSLYGINVYVYIVIDGISYLYKTLADIEASDLFIYIDLSDYLVNCNISDLTSKCYRHFHYTQYLNQSSYLDYLIANRTPTNTEELSNLFVNNENLTTKSLAISEYKVIDRGDLDPIIIVFGGATLPTVTSIEGEYLVTNYNLIDPTLLVTRVSSHNTEYITIYSNSSYLDGVAVTDTYTYMRQSVNGTTMNIINMNISLTVTNAYGIMILQVPKCFYSNYSISDSITTIGTNTHSTELDYFTKIIYNKNFSYILKATSPIALVGINAAYSYYSTYVHLGIPKSVFSSSITNYSSNRYSFSQTLTNSSGVSEHRYNTILRTTSHTQSNSSESISYQTVGSIKATGSVYITNLGEVIYNFSEDTAYFHIFTCTVDGTTYYGRLNISDYRSIESHINIYAGNSTVTYNYYTCYWRNS